MDPRNANDFIEVNVDMIMSMRPTTTTTTTTSSVIEHQQASNSSSSSKKSNNTDLTKECECFLIINYHHHLVLS